MFQGRPRRQGLGMSDGASGFGSLGTSGTRSLLKRKNILHLLEIFKIQISPYPIYLHNGLFSSVVTYFHVRVWALIS